SALWIDVLPQSRSDLVASIRGDGVDAAAVFIALAALTMIVLLSNAQPWIIAALIAAALIALLPLQFDEDPWHVFRFDVYASRILSGFSRSPLDLLLTAAAVLGIAVCLIRPLAARRSPLAVFVIRVAVAFLAAFGYLTLVRNLVDNARISPIPDHILPASLAQAVLLAALTLFAFALLALTRHQQNGRRTLILIALAVVPIVIGGLFLDPIGREGYWAIAAAIAASLLLYAFAPQRPLRLLGLAILVVPVVYIPLRIAEEASARKFIADTYAPLV